MHDLKTAPTRLRKQKAQVRGVRDGRPQVHPQARETPAHLGASPSLSLGPGSPRVGPLHSSGDPRGWPLGLCHPRTRPSVGRRAACLSGGAEATFSSRSRRHKRLSLNSTALSTRGIASTRHGVGAAGPAEAGVRVRAGAHAGRGSHATCTGG